MNQPLFQTASDESIRCGAPPRPLPEPFIEDGGLVGALPVIHAVRRAALKALEQVAL
jgi:hypothetical protein